MITLQKPIAQKWTGEGEVPIRIAVDRFKILRIDHDTQSGSITFSGAYGYIDEAGEFVIHNQANGSYSLISKTVLSGEEYTEFQKLTSLAGAPPDDFRISDLEQVIVSKGLVDIGDDKAGKAEA